MGIFSRHKGKDVHRSFFIHIHALSPFASDYKAVAVEWQRGKGRKGSTRAVKPTPQPGKDWATFEFEETHHVPCTLHAEPSAQRPEQGPFERKELLLTISDRSSSSSRARAPLGSITLNLAEYAHANKLQTALPVVLARGVGAQGGTPRLLVTVSCSVSDVAPEIQAVSSLSEVGDLPTTMSTDSEGGSRPQSRAMDSRPSSRNDSRPGSRAEARPAAAAAGNGPAVNGWAGLSAVRESSDGQAASRQLSAYDSEGFLRDSTDTELGHTYHAERSASISAVPAPVSALSGGSVKRNLGSALDRVEQSGSSLTVQAGARGGGRGGDEAQSRPALTAASAAVVGAGAAAAAGPGAEQLGTVPSGAPAQAAASDFAFAAVAAGGGGAGAALLRSGSSRGQAAAQQQQEQAVRPLGERMREERGLEFSDDGSQALGAEDSSLGDVSLSLPAAPTTGRAANNVLSPPPPLQRPNAGAGAAAAAAGEPDTPLDGGPPGDLLSPQPWSTGQSSLSAAGDPSVPFTVRPSTQRRFVRDEGGGGVRRWMWRQQPGARANTLPRAGASAAAAGAAAAAAQAQQAKAEAAVAAEGSQCDSEQPDASSHADPEAAAPAPDAGSKAGSTAHRLPTCPEDAVSSPFDGMAAVSGAAGVVAGAEAAAAERGHYSAGRPATGGSSFRLPASREESLLQALAGENSTMPLPSPTQTSIDAFVRELLTMAALESSIYLAGGDDTFPPSATVGPARAAMASSKRLHAPARRLARTVVSMGRQEGKTFALRAIKAVHAVCGAAAGDLHRLSFWWSNVMQLRWMVWALQNPTGNKQAGESADEESGGEASWLPEVLAPALQDLESQLFGEMLKLLWWGLLLPIVTGNMGLGKQPPTLLTPARTPGPGDRRGTHEAQTPQQQPIQGQGLDSPLTPQGVTRSFETPEEEAVQHWLDGLAAVQRVLEDPYRPTPAPRGHLKLLHRQLVVGLLRRLDTLLFRKLLEDTEERAGSFTSPSMLRSTSFMEDVLGASPLPLDASVLPFPRGPLTFSVGVNLKMAVSRLTQWAADAGVKEDKVCLRSTDGSDYRLFPCLRATADLLMMPKEVLADSEIRREVVPGLPMRRVLQILERFEPDDFAPEPIPPGLLERLEAETPTSAAPPSPTIKRSEEYLPPSEAGLLEEGLISTSSLKMDEESDDELEMLAEMYSGGEGNGTQRFALLRDLWSHAV